MEEILQDKSNIVFCVIFIIIIFVAIIFLRGSCTLINHMGFEIKDSEMLKGERGMFATKYYKKDEIIEHCPTLQVSEDDINYPNKINDYVFESNIEGDVLIPLGYCGLMNHSEERQNATWTISPTNEFIHMRAIKDIEPGEEIYVSYGKDYWDERATPKLIF